MDSDNFGFFDDDLNEQRDSKNKAYGIFSDDEIDEVHKNYGFYDDDLETISNNTKDSDFKIEEKENFGFFDEMPEITANSVMESNDIKEEKIISKAEIETAVSEEKVLVRKPRQKEEDEVGDPSKKSIPNNTSFLFVSFWFFFL